MWTMNITFYKEKLNPLSSLMTGATYWCKKQTAIVLVSDRQRNAASQKLMKLMILARYFIHVWIGVKLGCDGPEVEVQCTESANCKVHFSYKIIAKTSLAFLFRPRSNAII